MPLKKDLAEFAVLVRAGVDALRNIVNEPELLAWLEGIASERLGPVGSAFEGAQPTKEAKAREWLAKVARKHQLREGASAEVGPNEASSSASASASWSGLPWVLKAFTEKRRLSCLLLPDEEREKIASVLDWMRSPEGPLVSGDWTRISFEQALKAEHDWIEAKAKAYAKRQDDAAAEEGTTLFVDLSSLGEKWDGWRWVRVESALALDREGALMRHCVGSYAEGVAEGRKEIYGLRDPENKPRLTVEARGSTLAQLKGYANGACPEELREATEAFVSEFEKRADPVGLGLVKLSSDIERAGFAALPGVGVFKRDSGFSKEQKTRWERKLSNWADEKGKCKGVEYEKLVCLLAKMGMGKELCELLPLLDPGVKHSAALYEAASAGHKEIVEMLLPVSDPLARDSAALRYAAEEGHKEIMEMLLPVSDPLAKDSLALYCAASAGHEEIVKLLLPVSNPLARDSAALREAASGGHKAIVALLLPVSDPLANDSDALRWAASGGHKEVVELLLPVSNPLANGSQALLGAAYNGKKEIVGLLLPVSDPLAMNSQALRWAASEGHKEVVMMLLPVSNPLANDSLALCEAAKGGHKEIVELLLPVSNPLDRGSAALLCAARRGHKEIVAILLPLSDPLANDSAALRYAAEEGHKEVVAMLLPVSNPLADDSLALREAALAGHKEVVRMLAPCYRGDKEAFHRLLKNSGMDSNDFNFSTLDAADDIKPISDLMVGKIKGRRKKTLASGTDGLGADELHGSSNRP